MNATDRCPALPPGQAPKSFDEAPDAALARAEWLAFVARYEHSRRARDRAGGQDAPPLFGARLHLWLLLALSAALWVVVQ